jgi:hypothetical protein
VSFLGQMTLEGVAKSTALRERFQGVLYFGGSRISFSFWDNIVLR